MKYELDVHTFYDTLKCNENFACLEGENKCLCKVDHMLEGKLLFVKSMNDCIRDYRTSFGYSNFCNCPVRKEIFKRYNV